MTTSRSFAVFEVASDQAHFRRPYAITTALTFPVPPRTALCGLIGAILGLPKNDSLRHFQDVEAFIAVQLLEPLRTGHLSINLLDTKGSPTFRPKSVNPHTIMRYEVIRSPRYRVMFSHQTLLDQLVTTLERGETHYTPCLGLAWMIAWFEGTARVAQAELVTNNEEPCSLVTPIRIDELIGDVRWDPSGFYQRIRMSAEMQPDRLVTRYQEYIAETTGKPITASLKSYWRFPDGTCFSAL